VSILRGRLVKTVRPYRATAITALDTAYKRHVTWTKYVNTDKRKPFLPCLHNGSCKQLCYDTDCTHCMAANMVLLKPCTFIFTQRACARRSVSECPDFQKFLFRIIYFW